MAEAENIDSGTGSSSQPPGNVSLDAAIAFINDFNTSAQMVQQAVGTMLVIAASINAKTGENATKIGRLEGIVSSMSARIANLNRGRDELDRPLAGGGGSSSSAPTSTQLSAD